MFRVMELDRVWTIWGVTNTLGFTNTLGNISLSVSIGNSRVLVVTLKSKTWGTFIQNNMYLAVTFYFN